MKSFLYPSEREAVVDKDVLGDMVNTLDPCEFRIVYGSTSALERLGIALHSGQSALRAGTPLRRSTFWTYNKKEH
jgi:hypothetical protein